MSEHRDGVTICEHGYTLYEDCPICDRLFVEADASESSTPTVPAQGGEDDIARLREMAAEAWVIGSQLAPGSHIRETVIGWEATLKAIASRLSASPLSGTEGRSDGIDGPIRIRPSKTADTRSCDFASVTKQTLLDSSRQHIGDVRAGLAFFQRRIAEAAARHDTDKITDIDSFHEDFITGFTRTAWWDRHRKLNRHHLLAADGVPEDVNLIDVLDMIADCVMAGMARTGEVYPLDIDAGVLMRAFQNTVPLLQRNVILDQSTTPNEQAPPLPAAQEPTP